ncbi:MAG: hypothetical protein M1839_003706 [Geoglossum umbratile]|nr:MAG: hypothetical protein M1839_003706 [Geoglossum umbratile]
MTYNLYSHQAWLEYYKTRAAEVPQHIRASPSSFQSAMLAISEVALDNRAQQLRDSDSYTNKKLKTAAAGLIPFLKIAVSVDACEEFADEALQAFGLSDATGLKDLARRLKASTSGRGDVAMDILTTIASLSKSELLAHVGTHAAGEAWHAKPIVGQMVSAATGYASVRKRMISIIDKARDVAAKVHGDILVPLVVEDMRITAPLPAAKPPPVFPVAIKKRTQKVDPSSRIALKESFAPTKYTVTPKAVTLSPRTIPRDRFTLGRLFFEFAMSFLALLALCFCAYMAEEREYWGLLGAGLVTAYLLWRVRAFRVMFMSQILGFVLLHLYKLGEVEGSDSFLAASLGTAIGFGFLRM